MYQAQATDFKSEVSKLVGLYYRDPREGEWKEAQRKAKEKRRNVRDARPEPYIDFGSIFIPADYKKATLIADHLPLYDIEDVLILGNSTWNNPDLPQRSQHVNGAIFTDGFYPHSKRDQTSTFVANFHSTFEEDPHRLAAYAFDSAEILINLLQDPRNQSRETLQNALLQLKNYEGATGRFSFAENGEVLKEPFLLKVEKRKIVEAQESEGS
jgi:hypothetical protein